MNILQWMVQSNLWILFASLQYLLVSYVAFKASKTQSTSAFILMYCMVLIPTWTTVCKFSRNLVVDGFIFDFILAGSWTVMSVVFENKNFGAAQYAGILLMFSGFILFKR